MHFLPFLLLNFALGSLNISKKRISELADEFEAEFPGSVDWLQQWAVAEYELDKMKDLFEGQKISLPLPNYTSRFAIATTFYILSTNPDMSVVEFAGHVARLLGPNCAKTSFVQKTYQSAQSTLRVPDWFFSHIIMSRAAGLSKEAMYESLYEFVGNMRNGGAIATDDLRFSNGDGKIRGLAHLWNRFGFQRPGEKELPAVMDHDTLEWVLRQNVKTEALQYMTLAFLAPPSDTASA